MADHRRIKGRICNRVRHYFRIRQSKMFRILPELDPQHRRIAFQAETVSTDTSAFDSDEVSEDEEPVTVVSFGPKNHSSIDQVRWIFIIYLFSYSTSADVIIFFSISDPY